MNALLENTATCAPSKTARAKPHIVEDPLQRMIRLGAIPEPVPLGVVKQSKREELLKARAECKAPFPMKYFYVRRAVLSVGMFLLIGGSVLGLVESVAAVIAFIVDISRAGAKFNTHMALGTLCFVACLVGISITAFASGCVVPYWKRWTYYDFEHWGRGLIPADVAMVKREIELRLPEARPFVEELVHTDDPWFGIEYHNKRYYLIGWK